MSYTELEKLVQGLATLMTIVSASMSMGAIFGAVMTSCYFLGWKYDDVQRVRKIIKESK